jgi:hypothetical protein
MKSMPGVSGQAGAGIGGGERHARLPVMIANLLLICSAALCGALLPVSDTTDRADRFFLTCQGTMRVAGAPAASPIITEGIVDLAKRRVYGFGLGGEQVIVLAAGQVGFASPEPTASAAGTIDGSIDLRTGKTTIAMHAAGNPGSHLIDMDLECRLQPQVVED